MRTRKLSFDVNHTFYRKASTGTSVYIDNPTETEALELAISALTHPDLNPSFALPDMDGQNYSVDHARNTALKWLARWQLALARQEDEQREIDALHNQLMDAGADSPTSGVQFRRITKRAHELGARPKPPELPHDF